jgi:NAD(P)-dependent dehydrogenase (short-subunit alcohol dehydrogenase family)
MQPELPQRTIPYQRPCDISNEQNRVALAESALREFGQIDLLVNLAAFQSTHEELHEIT